MSFVDICCGGSSCSSSCNKEGAASRRWKSKRWKLKRNYGGTVETNANPPPNINSLPSTDYYDEIPHYNPYNENCCNPSNPRSTMKLAKHAKNANCKLKRCVSELNNCDADDDEERNNMRFSSTSFFSVTFYNLLVICTTLLFICASRVDAFPSNDCDWSGSGTPENVVQAVYLRCQQGHIVWEHPRGGLRITISPPKYLIQAHKPYRLCLETVVGSNFKVFLEQDSSSSPFEANEEGGWERRKLLPFIAPNRKSPTCYRIDSPTATLYVESQSQQEEVGTATLGTNDISSSLSLKDAYQVKISYEIEEIRELTSRSECRPCTEQEVLNLYCVADVVARGEILSVRPSSQRQGLDNLHIKSNLLIHQNHPVFQPLNPGRKSLQKFLMEEIQTFDQYSPKKATKSKPYGKYAGIVSHPSSCAAQDGPGEFLWLIKLSFGRPKIGCVLYWDNWVQLAREAEEKGTAKCPLVYA